MDTRRFVTLLYARAPQVPVTVLLVAANVLLLFVTSVVGGAWLGGDRPTLIRFGANLAPLVTGGEPWRLIAAPFLHAGVIHLAFNMYALWQAGQLVERLYGSIGFLLLYLGAALSGSIATVWWRQDVVSVGASGAVFGVYGALAAYLLVQRGSVPLVLLRSLRASTLLFVVYSLGAGFLLPGIDNAAHLGGLAGGALLGAGLARPLAAASALELASSRTLGTMALLAAICLVALRSVPDVSADYRRQAELERLMVAFATEETALIGQYRALLQDMRQRRVGTAAGVVAIRDDLVVRWNRQVAQLNAFSAPQEALERRRQLLVRYAEARRDALSLLAQAMEAGDSALLEKSNAKQVEADRLIEALRSSAS